MGMVPPMLPPFLRRRQPPQTKEEHPQQEEWEQVRQQAEMRGLVHSNGTIAVPPPGGSVIASPPEWRVDPKLIGEESR